MTQEPEILAAARSTTYQFLALAFGYPDADRLAQLKALPLQLEASQKVLQDTKCLDSIATVRAILDPLAAAEWHSTYLRYFGHTISKEFPPYETEYGQSHIFRKSQKLADIAGFYQAFGVDLSPEINDRWDHVSVELEFMQLLCLKEAYALAEGHAEEEMTLCRDAQAAFLEEHLGCWVLGFARRLGKKTDDSIYFAMAELLENFLNTEMRRLDLHPETEMPPLLEEDFDDPAAGCQSCSVADPAATLEQGGLQ